MAKSLFQKVWDAHTVGTLANGQITGDDKVRTYLGRPWRDYAQVTFVNTSMSDVVREEGWHNWDRPGREKTARYQELGSTGPGATSRGRVTWVRALTSGDAQLLTATSVLGGADGWNPLSR